MATTKDTKLLGVLGNPLKHTFSPKMHSYFAQETGLDTAYLAFEVEKDDLSTIVDGAKKMGAIGFNVTSPYKIDIMSHIDVIDPEAELMGAVNTIVNRDGKWYGYNTDGDGFVNSLIAQAGDIVGRKVLIIGAGGSARSIAYKLAKKGVESISFHAKTQQKIDVIYDVIRKNTECKCFKEMDLNEVYDIIINTTPLGMHPYENENPFIKHIDMISKGTICCDLIYNPAKTLFLQSSEQRGAKIINGLSMFVLQGVYAYELFCGVKLDEKCIEGATKLLSEDIN
jgi:shikimate dehydrogenase